MWESTAQFLYVGAHVQENISTLHFNLLLPLKPMNLLVDYFRVGEVGWDGGSPGFPSGRIDEADTQFP